LGPFYLTILAQKAQGSYSKSRIAGTIAPLKPGFQTAGNLKTEISNGCPSSFSSTDFPKIPRVSPLPADNLIDRVPKAVLR
jgi:hypothetical protein